MKYTGDYELDEINMLEQECADLEEENRRLEEENKNLKLIQETNEKQIQNDIKERDELREENKNLKEKVETLELWLDNKEKLNEEYRKQVDLLKCQSLWPSELADSLYDADKTIKNLNDRVKELIWKIDQLEEENENLSKDLFHLTNDGQRKNPTATQWAEWVIREWGEEQGKNARDS